MLPNTCPEYNIWICRHVTKISALTSGKCCYCTYYKGQLSALCTRNDNYFGKCAVHRNTHFLFLQGGKPKSSDIILIIRKAHVYIFFSDFNVNCFVLYVAVWVHTVKSTVHRAFVTPSSEAPDFNKYMIDSHLMHWELIPSKFQMYCLMLAKWKYAYRMGKKANAQKSVLN